MAEMKKVVILGAGPAGLGAGFHLSRKGYSVSIIDRAHYIGGASASFRIKDYIVDYGPHAFHIKNEGITRMVKGLLAEDYVEVKRKSRLILDGKDLHYPLDIREALFKINPLLSLKILADYILIRCRNILLKKNRRFGTFEEWGTYAFGRTLYRLAFGDYSEKMWGVSGKLLSSKLAQQKLLKLDLWKLILKVLGIVDTTFEGGVTQYYDMYPPFGIGTIFERMSAEIRKNSGSEILLNAQILKICRSQGRPDNIGLICGGKERRIAFDYLISTIPLKYLSGYLNDGKDSAMNSLCAGLNYRDLRIIYIVLDKDYYSDAHWIYLLDPHFKFNRLSEQKNLNKDSSPQGRTVISLDIACNEGDRIWNMADEEFFQLAMGDLGYMGIERSHILDHFNLKLKDVYPVYSLDFDARLAGIFVELSKHENIYSTGRQGLFLNNDIHDSMDMGIKAAEFVLRGEASGGWHDYVSGYIKERLEGNKK
ncbi:hypothetical protein EPN16_01665 [bacterium]|nr:MAG: hypothetical protein EPN16_01665 [bacterium]